MSTAVASIRRKIITGEELSDLGNIGPCELIAGRIAKISPAGIEHGRLEAKLARKLGMFVEESQPGEVLVGETGIYTKRNPDTVRGADIIYISHDCLRKATPGKFLDIAPELVVEILSPGDRWRDANRKVDEYLALGVSWVWVIEPKKKTISVFNASGETRQYEEGDILEGEGLLTGFRLDVKDFFSLR